MFVLSASICLIILILIFILKAYITEFLRYSRMLAALPGQKKTFRLGKMFRIGCDDESMFKKLRRLSSEFYPCYTLSVFNFVSINICGPDEFEAIACSTRNVRKSRIYRFLDYWMGNGLLVSTGNTWHTRRKIITPAFHFNILQDFVAVFNREAGGMVENLRATVGTSVDIIPFINQFTLKAITETAMGITLDVSNESDKLYFHAIKRIGKIFLYRLLRPWLYSDLIHYYLTFKGRFELGLIRTIHDFTQGIIDERSKNFELIDDKELNEEYRYSGRKKKRALLDLLLNAKIGKGLIDNKGIQDEVNTFMFEGYDTTSMCIAFTLMLLAHHKDVQDLVYQEILQVLGKCNTTPTLNELNDLKYMERVIKESLRLYPVAPFIARKLVEDVHTKSGYVFPRGANVFIHIFDILRDPRHWDEPEKFDPDRFLPENCLDRHAFAYVPFSAGPRNCIGQRFALLELKTVLNCLLQHFILETVDTPDSIVLVPDIVMRTKSGRLHIKLLPRFSTNL